MHMWAVHWFVSNGPVHDWDSSVASDTMAAKAARASYKSQKMNVRKPHDDTFTATVDHLLGTSGDFSGTLHSTTIGFAAGDSSDVLEPESSPVSELKEIVKPRRTRRPEACVLPLFTSPSSEWTT